LNLTAGYLTACCFHTLMCITAAT